MRRLGPIVRLQVQDAPLKVMEHGQRRYTTASIRPVERLLVTREGLLAPAASGEWVPDVHHEGHPLTRNIGRNHVSVLFTSAYHAMRERFGPHLTDGVAGESILVERDEIVDEEDVSRGLIVVTASGIRIELHDLVVAEPCTEFTAFALGGDPENRDVAKALPALRHGRRGFYTRYSGEPSTIARGDMVYAAGD